VERQQGFDSRDAAAGDDHFGSVATGLVAHFPSRSALRFSRPNAIAPCYVFCDARSL
jgi:hypothetical protein